MSAPGPISRARIKGAVSGETAKLLFKKTGKVFARASPSPLETMVRRMTNRQKFEWAIETIGAAADPCEFMADRELIVWAMTKGNNSMDRHRRGGKMKPADEMNYQVMLNGIMTKLNAWGLDWDLTPIDM